MTALEIVLKSYDYTESHLVKSHCPNTFIRGAKMLCLDGKKDCVKCWEQKFDKEDSK